MIIFDQVCLGGRGGARLRQGQPFVADTLVSAQLMEHLAPSSSQHPSLVHPMIGQTVKN